MKNVIKSVMVLVGTFIGAGFASGQEILQYFGIYGNFGVLGIAISCVLLSLFTYCCGENIAFSGSKRFLESLCKYRVVKWLVNAYMLVIFGTMISAFGESLQQALGIPKICGVLFMDVVTVLTLYFGAVGLIKLNAVVTPVIIVGIIWVFVSESSTAVFNNFAVSSVVYTSYNVVSLPFVMAGMENVFVKRKNNIVCSVGFGAIIFSLALCILKLLEGGCGYVSVPLLNVVSKEYEWAFLVVLGMSMLTTAVSNGYGFISAINVNKKVLLWFVGIFGIVFSFFRFEFIVRYLYSLCGFIGFYMIIKIFYDFIKNREKPRKTEIKGYN